MQKKIILLIAVLIGLNSNINATVTTHAWANNLRGYSIEEIPGSSSIEYIAVGTVFDKITTGYHSVHFMRLDASGNVIVSKVRYIPTPGGTYIGYDVTYRVVDVAVESSNSFWVTIQATQVPSGRSFILPIAFDQNGDYVYTYPITNTIAIKTGTSDYSNIYPVHTLFYDESLYVCGYLAKPETGDAPPNKYSTKKKGFVIRLTKTPSTCFSYGPYYVWDTHNHLVSAPSQYDENGIYDYDMAMKMKLSTDEKSLLVTGAMNTTNCNGCESGILALKLDSKTLGVQYQTGLYIPGPSWGANPPTNGLYGIDIYENPDPSGNPDSPTDPNDIFVLANYFQYDDIHRWGVGILEGDLDAPPVGNYAAINTITYPVEWAKQFFPGNVTSSAAELSVVGEKIRFYNTCGSPTPFNPPSTTNVDPFVSKFTYTGNSTTGITGATRNSHYVHLSNFSTLSGSGFNYLTSSVSGLLDDVTRLHTFATLTSSGSIAMINPVAPWVDAAYTARYLNCKFNLVSFAGAESSCEHTLTDCDPGTFVTTMFNNGEFVADQMYLEGMNFNWDVDPTLPYSKDCSTGAYRTNIELQSVGNNDMYFYPNPTKDILNIRFTESVKQSDTFSFVLTDLTGKVVYTNDSLVNKAVISLQLPSLTPGVYIGKATHNGKAVVQKISIR